MPLSELDKGWMAALLDSEGYIRKAAISTTTLKPVNRPPYERERFQYPDVRIVNTSLELLQRARRLSGGQIYPHHSEWGKKPSHVLVIMGKDAVKSLLQELLPHLIVKREAASLAIKDIEKHASETRFPWNKGLTKESDTILRRWSEQRRK